MALQPLRAAAGFAIIPHLEPIFNPRGVDMPNGRISMMAAVVLFAFSAPALAQKTFLGQEIKGPGGTYLSIKDANVRAKPMTKGKKLGTIAKGSRVLVLGKAKGASNWLAVSKDGKDFGFVYAPILLPLIDGKLDKDITGELKGDGAPDCRYTIVFEGQNPVEGASIVFADYDVEFTCEGKNRKVLSFHAPMFITEAPYDMSYKPVYQISVDILEIQSDIESVLSTGFFYDARMGVVTFSEVSIKEFAQKRPVPKRKAASAAQAVTAAVEMAYSAWNGKVWEALAQALR